MNPRQTGAVPPMKLSVKFPAPRLGAVPSQAEAGGGCGMIVNAMVLEQEATQAQLQRILQSKTFRTSEVHRSLLNYLVEKSVSGQADTVKEYTLGLDVFGKPASYDPRQESTVRMHVARLRQKLADYYRTEGVDDPIYLDLPKGGFRVSFEPRPLAEAPATVASNEETPRIFAVHYRVELGLAVALLLAISLAAYFALRLRTAANAPTESLAQMTPELQELWGPMLSANRPLMLCLATPSSNFPGVGGARGAFLLGQFLSKHQNVVLTPSEQLSAPEIAMGNVVFLGPMTGNRQIQAVPANQEILLEPQGIRVLDPRAGEPALFTDHLPADSLDVEESYALISHVPGLYNDGEILYISGNRIASVMGGVKAFTDPDFAKVLLQKMRAGGAIPAYYQIVLKVRAMDDMPLDYTYVLHRTLTAHKDSAAKQRSQAGQ